MTALILTPVICSTAVGALSFLGVRPLAIVWPLIAVVGGCWVFA